MKTKVKNQSRALSTWLTNGGLVVALLALGWHLHGSATINFFNTPTLNNLQSNGTAMDSTFSFQLGTFDTGFVPTSTNLGDWESKWNPIPLDAPYNDATDDFQGVATLTDNTVFAEGDQAYIWGYTDKAASSVNQEEWVLLKNDAWDIPDAVQDGVGEVAPNEFWWLDDLGTTALLGDMTSEEYAPGFFGNAIQSASVPEPSAGLLLLFAATAGILIRRRS